MIVEQILLASTLGNVLRAVWRICLLMSLHKKFNKYSETCYILKKAIKEIKMLFFLSRKRSK